MCLVALFAQVVFPIAHQYYLDVAEMSEKTMVAAADARRIGIQAVGVQSGCRGGGHGRSSHDPESCAVCQVLLHASSFIGAVPPGTVYTALSTDPPAVDNSPGMSARYGSTECRPRAPPFCSEIS